MRRRGLANGDDLANIHVFFDNVPDSSVRVRVLVETLMLIHVGSMMFITIGKSLGARFLGAALSCLGNGCVHALIGCKLRIVDSDGIHVPFMAQQLSLDTRWRLLFFVDSMNAHTHQPILALTQRVYVLQVHQVEFLKVHRRC